MPARLHSLALGLLALSLAACAAGPDPKATVQAITPGEIVAAEQVASADSQGANAAVRVGAAVLGALVPGPWGGVAGTAGGEAGRAVLRNTGGQWRYFVRMADGTLRTIEQADGPALRKGAKVDVIEMSDGTLRIVANAQAPQATPAVAPGTLPFTAG